VRRQGEVGIYLGVPTSFAAKAQWVWTTLLAALGRRPRFVLAPAAAEGCTLAYARQPVDGVRTVPCSEVALDLIAHNRPLPPGTFVPQRVSDGQFVAAFPARQEGFALPFDLIAASFFLLAAWDEHTAQARDRFGRLPYAESTFARQVALGERALTEPPVDRYVESLAGLMADHEGEARLTPPTDAQWAAGARFAVALTHDVDEVQRWTARGVRGAVKRVARAARAGDFATAQWEARAVARAFVHDLPRGYDPSWTFPDLLAREDRRGLTSTFFLLASHSAPVDGSQPEIYRARLPQLITLLRSHGREIALHGNQRDRDDARQLSADRATLSALAGSTVLGMRYHYLRCSYHDTLPLLDHQGFVYDSSLAFSEHEGYRCGFSHPFHPYDLSADRPLGLVELPLAVMDSTLQERQYRSLPALAAQRAASTALEPLTRSGGAAAILWHHNRFDPYFGRGYDQVYWDLVDWIHQHGGVATSALEIVQRWKQRLGETLE